MIVLYVAEHLVGIRHVFVYVVEIGKHELSPTVEMVKALFNAGASGKDLVQIANEFY